MSVYIVPKATLDILVTAGAKRGMIPLTRLAAYGRKLHTANVDAFNFHYTASPRAVPLYRFEVAERDDATIREAMEEFVYQCEDMPGWRTSEAAKYIAQLHHAMNTVCFGVVA